MQCLEILHPGQGYIVVGPDTGNSHADFIITGAVKFPVINRSNMLDHVYRINIALKFNLCEPHVHPQCVPGRFDLKLHSLNGQQTVTIDLFDPVLGFLQAIKHKAQSVFDLATLNAQVRHESINRFTVLTEILSYQPASDEGSVILWRSLESKDSRYALSDSGYWLFRKLFTGVNFFWEIRIFWRQACELPALAFFQGQKCAFPEIRFAFSTIHFPSAHWQPFPEPRQILPVSPNPYPPKTARLAHVLQFPLRV